jgi:hypothetical protein
MSGMGPRVEHRIGVQASPDRIWEVFSNLPRWRDWNPMYPEASGSFVIGGTLHLLEHAPGRADQRLTARILDWTPYAQLVLRIEEGFMAHRLQYFEIEKLSDSGCIFAAGTYFNGWRGPAAARRLARGLKVGFGLMAEALKEKVERET